MTNQKNICTISPEEDFLASLATYIFKLVDGDMLGLSRVRVILPNRRSVLKIKDEFLKLSASQAVLLPQIMSLSGVDETDEQILKLIGVDEIVPIISDERRQMLLAELIIENASSFGIEQINFDIGLKLARSLADLLDDMEKHSLGVGSLEEILPDELSRHRQVSLEFIRFVFTEYPKILSTLGVTDRVKRTNQILDVYTRSLQANGSDTPIFIAGSTGSIPATRRLIKAISTLHNGYVILPYIDLNLNSFEWREIGGVESQISHQKHIFTLLKELQVQPSEVKMLQGASSEKQKTISNMMRSASSLQSWRQQGKGSDLGWIKLAVAENIHHESKVISAIIRQKLGQGASVALVTNNRVLASSVQLYLRKLGVNIDDSSGLTLDRTLEGSLLLSAASLISRDGRVTELLSFLKHQLSGFSSQHLARLEKDLIRKNNIKDLHQLLQLPEILDDKEFGVLRKLGNAFRCEATLTSLVNAAYQMIEAISPKLESSQNWQDITTHVGNYTGLKELKLELPIFADSLQSILSGKKIWPRYTPNQSAAILSPIESRLQHFDCVILGDMTLGSWPAGKFSPWFSRNMFKDMELPFEEDSISLAAHDFAAHLHQKEVYITYSHYSSGEPLIESPFVSRLKAFYKALHEKDMPFEAEYNSIVEVLDGNFVERKQAVMPKPKVPSQALIKRLSVTKIETLLKNPYAIYASEVLKLRKLDELEKEPDAAEYGNFCHNVLEAFTKHHKLDVQNIDTDSFNKIVLETHAKFKQKNLANDAWVKQVCELGNWFVPLEKETISTLSQLSSENKTEVAIGDFILVSKPDRVEFTKDGFINIADYKTGSFANQKQVGRLVSPQIPLEAYVLQRSGVVSQYKFGNIIYYNFSFSKGGPEKKIYSKLNLDSLVEDVDREIKGLIADLNDTEAPYLIRPNPKLQPEYDDYEHLERVEG